MDEDDELIFEKSNKNKPPLFENESHGVTLWIDKDKNGNNFLRLKLPLGLGTIPLFVNDSGYDNVQKNFNQLVDYLDD